MRKIDAWCISFFILPFLAVLAQARMIGTNPTGSSADRNCFGGIVRGNTVVSASEVCLDSSGNWLPTTANNQTLGTSALPWNGAFTNGITNTGNDTISGTLVVNNNATLGASTTNTLTIKGTTVVVQNLANGVFFSTSATSAASNVILSLDGSNLRTGIGTTTPASKLDVNGGVSVGSYAGTNAAPSNGLIVSGNVGIGTNSPAVALHISSGGIILDGTSGTTNKIDISGINTTAAGLADSPNGPVRIKPRSSIDDDLDVLYAVSLALQGSNRAGNAAKNISLEPFGGNVGIGTNQPATLLHMSSGTLTIDGNVAPSIDANDGVGIGSFTTAQVQGKSPSRAGQLIYNSTLAKVCVSTGTTVQGYARVNDGTTCQ